MKDEEITNEWKIRQDGIPPMVVKKVMIKITVTESLICAIIHCAKNLLYSSNPYHSSVKFTLLSLFLQMTN